VQLLLPAFRHLYRMVLAFPYTMGYILSITHAMPPIFEL
jgi:hypothetical protein